MTVIVCIDDRSGMLLNNLRRSWDNDQPFRKIVSFQKNCFETAKYQIFKFQMTIFLTIIAQAAKLSENIFIHDFLRSIEE